MSATTLTPNLLGDAKKCTVVYADDPQPRYTRLDDQLASQVVNAYDKVTALALSQEALDEVGVIPAGEAHEAALAVAAGLAFDAGRTAARRQMLAAFADARTTTPAAHPLRLHLLSAHGDVNGLELPDLLAELLHQQLHAEGANHPVEDLSWAEARCRQVVAAIPADAGRDAVENAFSEVFRSADPAGW